MPSSQEQPNRPNGREIDVLSLDADTRRSSPDASAHELHLCEACSSELVYPTDWNQDGERWRVALRCPECEWSGEGVFDQDAVDAFDEQLEQGTQELLKALRELARANMSEYVDRFLGALAADAIVPEDFVV